jgi:hypothetical protein
MARCVADESIQRHVIDGFSFPLGVYPVEEMTPRPGYSTEFEAADPEEDDADWESWPDRYVYDVVVPATRIGALWDQLFALMPGRVFPILDFIGHDAFREVDPYMAYEPVGKERVTDAIRRFRDFFFEDGMVGFGVVSDEPFLYLFVDEHKILTVRAEPDLKPQVEGVLRAFDLEPTDEPAGADAAAHEHRGVLLAPRDRPDLLTGEEVVEELRERWRLLLNIDPESNLDDEGEDLGFTPWRCLVRCSNEKSPDERYAEVLLVADRLRRAEELAMDAGVELMGESGGWTDVVVVAADRLTPELLAEAMAAAGTRNRLPRKRLNAEATLNTRWLEPA